VVTTNPDLIACEPTVPPIYYQGGKRRLAESFLNNMGRSLFDISPAVRKRCCAVRFCPL
jgi:hypothetical protein